MTVQVLKQAMTFYSVLVHLSIQECHFIFQVFFTSDVSCSCFQMSPEVFSDFGRQQQFQKSMLERLYDLYPDSCPCKVMLCENYRSNHAIIEFTSELFYDHKLTASRDPVAHSVYYPLTFFTARGEEVQHENSSGYFNTAEVSRLDFLATV